MGKPDSLAWTSLALAVLVALCAGFLGVQLWRERRSREPELPVPDRKHFLFQDMRRVFGILMMGLLAVGVYTGSRLPAFVTEVGAEAHPGRKAHPNPLFLAVWLSVFAAVLILLALGLIDWISTRQFARRHRQAMDRERLELLRGTIRPSDPTGDGRADEFPIGPA
jgi:TRAP-type C4-dicarboxylate transport system permease small subunit